MKIKSIITLGLLFVTTFYFLNPALAEDKNYSGGMIPKLPKTADDPELVAGHVYPNWGTPCQRYTYSVIYRDKEGRKPEYIQIYFNGKMIDIQKENPNDNDYKKGVKYIYQYVPNKVDSNFYYFEASNGLGKTRASIIDSPDNGPVLFTTAFDKNEIAVVEKNSSKKILSFSTGKEWIGGIALSDDGKYLAAKTSKHIYLFDTSSPQKPLWEFDCEQCRIGDDVKGGIDLSGNGSKIIAAFGERVVLLDKASNKPIWMYDKAGNSYNVAISHDGKYAAAATAGDEANVNSNLIILWDVQSSKPLWQYHASGNFHDVSLSGDGKFITGSTGCPDRRFYLFEKSSNKPLIKSDPLTRDSPVHRAKISADGTLVAIGSESDAGAVFLFSKDKGQVWKFPTAQGSSVRALNFTPNGQYVGAATFGGNAYIFAKDKNSPIASWKVNASLGGIDIADDGSFIATGGTDNKLHIFEQDSKKETVIPFEEYIEEVDISANGKYIAAGTGGSVYFFETYISQDRGKVFDCSNVIEPISENQMMQEAGVGNFGEQVKSSLCGDGRCEGLEAIDNCARDCGLQTNRKSPGMLFGLGFLLSLVTFFFYLAVLKFQFFQRIKEIGVKHRKKIITILSLLAGIFLILTIASLILNKPATTVTKPKESVKTEIENSTQNSGNELTPKQNEQNPPSNRRGSGVCGNDLCEPDLGETKENCPGDCSAGD